MLDNDKIFVEFWQSYQWFDAKPIYFRLYHDDKGRPLCYSHDDIAGSYIEVTPEQFAVARMDVLVRNNQIITPSPPLPPKLKPAAKGVACHPEDVTVIVCRGNRLCWSLQDHEN